MEIITWLAMVDLNQKNCSRLPRIRYSQSSYLLFITIFFLILLGTAAVYYPNLVWWGSLFLAIPTILYVKPFWGLYFLIAIIPLRNTNIIIDSPVRELNEIINLILPLSILFFIVFIIRHIVVDKNRLSANGLAAPIIFLVGWALLSFLWSLDPYHALNMLSSFIVIIVFLYFVPSLLKCKTQLNKIMCFSLVIGLVTAAATTISFWHEFEKEIELTNGINFLFKLMKHGNRAGGLSPASHAALILNSFIFIAIAQLYKARSWKKLLVSLIILFMVFNVFLTGSKGGIGSLIISLFFLMFITDFLRRKATVWIGTFIISISIVLLAKSIITQEGITGMREVASATSGSFSVETRLKWWGEGFEQLYRSNGVGLGVGGFPIIIDPEAPGAHSFYFSLLFDLGIIGMIFIGWFFLKLLILIMNSIKKLEDREIRFTALCLTSAIIAFLIQGLVDADYVYIPFWMLLGLLLSIFNISRNSSVRLSSNL